MAGAKFIPRGMRRWEQRAEELSTDEIVRMYNAGYCGVYAEPAEREAFLGSLANADGETVAYDSGMVGDGAGKLSLPYLYAFKHWPTMWPCPGQSTGDCVAHGGKNSALVLIGVEAVLAKPDPVTGIIEGYPTVTARAEQQGVVACENIYGDRGHGGQGASCGRLQNYVTSKGGILLRQKYPELGLDFTDYNASIGIRWGSSGVPAKVNEEGKKHQIRDATNCDNHEICRDFVANGYPIWCCSSLGWSSSRDENGYSRRQGGWSHSWIVMGYDDRAETKSKYGFPLFLYNHDWGRWNGGGRRILGTEIDIPEGSFWADARLLNQCETVAMASLNGWPRQAPDLPDFMVL